VLTISEVAKIAGVSVATISRVLNDSPLVSEKTRSRVKKVIKDLDYHPNVVAQNLSSSKSRILLALVPNISNPFHAEIVHGINKVVYARGYNLLLCETHGIREREDAFFNMLKQKIVEGMLAIDPAVSADNLRNYGASYPIIQCCEYKNGVDLPYVGIDDEQGAFAAVSHLIATGCRQIAMVNASGSFGFARLRRAGYLRALQAHGLTPDPGMVIEYNMGEDSGEIVAKRLLNLKRRADGIFFDYDVVAVGAQRALIDAGVRVPEDVSIVGFDGSDMTLICTPTLTTVAQPAYQIGLKSAEMLFAVMEGRALAEKRVTLEFELKVRQSTR
jgi:LacI family transcriptional regulator, repressor for deo operon, udp, cdd, tsx, nupC, and nupG